MCYCAYLCMAYMWAPLYECAYVYLYMVYTRVYVHTTCTRVCVHAACTCVYVYIVCTRVYAWQSEEDIRNSTLSLLYSLEGGSVTECGADMAVSKYQGSSCPHTLPSHWSSRSVQDHSQFLYRFWSFEPRTTCCVECILFH